MVVRNRGARENRGWNFRRDRRPLCKNCQYPERSLWAVGPPYPGWDTIEAANFVSLVRCPECKQLWIEIPYEPFASFRYAVRWPFSESVFSMTMNKDAGLTLSRWHEAEVRVLANDADDQTLAHIDAHYRRSRGYVKLTRSSQPNTVQIGASDLLQNS